MRYFIEFSYNGKNYFGWQRQPQSISVQQVIEECLSTLLREEIAIVGAGRTDSGVHAKQMFAHFDCNQEINENLTQKLNSFLPQDVAIKRIFRVNAQAHARFDALSRTYQYQICTEKDPFYEDFAFRHTLPLNLKAMNQACQILMEYEDFKCFSKSKTDVKTYLCHIHSAHWEKQGNLLIFNITADRFLRNMVRAIVGTLLQVGQGKTSLEALRGIIQSRNRGKAGVSVPAHGLFLTQILYPKNIHQI